jgi:hypothetical protein
MNDDYLWDKSGNPDPKIQRLEGLLAPLAYRPGRQFRAPRRRWPILIAIAATVTVIVGAAWIWLESRTPTGPSWQVIALHGPQKQQKFYKGGTVETDAFSRVRLNLDTFGRVELEPNTRVKLLVAKDDEQRMSLAHGKIHALIWAPPGQFYVNTPSSVTIDLGCSYTLEVDDKTGNGTLRVDYGWVAFEDHGRESFIPAHAVCITRRGRGPGIPYYEDAPPALQSAVDRFDTTDDLRTVLPILAGARERDALTLWHLLRRVPAQNRAEVFDRLAQLIEVPQGVKRDRVLAGDPKAYDDLWDALGLGEVTWWRMWKR